MRINKNLKKIRDEVLVILTRVALWVGLAHRNINFGPTIRSKTYGLSNTSGNIPI